MKSGKLNPPIGDRNGADSSAIGIQASSSVKSANRLVLLVTLVVMVRFRTVTPLNLALHGREICRSSLGAFVHESRRGRDDRMDAE